MGSIPVAHPFPPTPTTSKPCSKPRPPRAAPEPPPAASEPQPPPPDADPDFDSRLSQVRRKYRSGSGKKAELRRSKRSSPSSAAAKKAAVMLPPVPLREPRASSGVRAELGFTPYSEGLNGAAAAVGLAALLLVELGSGKGLLQFHAPPILFVQLYAAAAAAALYIKWERERISVWPEKKKASEEPE